MISSKTRNSGTLFLLFAVASFAGCRPETNQENKVPNANNSSDSEAPAITCSDSVSGGTVPETGSWKVLAAYGYAGTTANCDEKGCVFLDSATGLAWTGENPGAGGSTTWTQAKAQCGSLSYMGIGTHWRLPSSAELQLAWTHKIYALSGYSGFGSLAGQHWSSDSYSSGGNTFVHVRELAKDGWPGTYTADNSLKWRCVTSLYRQCPSDKAPVASPLTVQVLQDQSVKAVLVATDPQKNPLSFKITSPPGKGTAYVSGSELYYSPGPFQKGKDTLSYTASNWKHTSEPAFVTIDIIPVNHAPVAAGFNLIAHSNKPLTFPLRGTDGDGDAITYSITTPPTNGALSQNGANLTYTPGPDYLGYDSFKYRASDGLIQSGTATVHIHVVPPNMLIPPEAGSYKFYGYSIDVQEDLAAIGAPETFCSTPPTATSAGSVYLYKKALDGWLFEAKLTPSDGVLAQGFGNKVSISGTRILIGAANPNCTDGPDIGSAYVFALKDGTWIEEAKLTVPAAGGYFGSAVALEGNTAVVGEKYNGGNAHIFQRKPDGTWALQETLKSPSFSNEFFGSGVAISGDVIAVGASFGSNGTHTTGAIYLHRWNGSKWAREARLAPTDGVGFDSFGTSLALSGSFLITGVSRRAVNGVDNTGTAYVYAHNGTQWLLNTQLAGPVPASSFGADVDIHNGKALISAPYRAEGSALYQYSYEGSSWVLSQTLVGPGSVGGQMACVALSAHTVFAGLPYANYLASSSGAAAYFSVK